MSCRSSSCVLIVTAFLTLDRSSARAADPDTPFTCLKTWLAAGFFDTAGDRVVFRDGLIKSARSIATTGNWILGRVGSWYSSCPSCYLNGDLAEILVYECALSDADRSRVDTYLRNKFALP
jgi:hypothetical protein